MSTRNIRKDYNTTFSALSQAAMDQALHNHNCPPENKTEVPDLAKHPRSLPEARIAISLLQKGMAVSTVAQKNLFKELNYKTDVIYDLRQKVSDLKRQLADAKEQLAVEQDLSRSRLEDANARADNLDKHHNRTVSEFYGYRQAIETILTAGKSN